MLGFAWAANPKKYSLGLAGLKLWFGVFRRYPCFSGRLFVKSVNNFDTKVCRRNRKAVSFIGEEDGKVVDKPFAGKV